jgi:N-glycosylase/DNA lyase
MKYTIESAQPLAFHSDYDTESGILIYPRGDNIVTVTHSGNKDRAVLKVDKRYSKEVAEMFRLSDNMDKVYAYIETDAFMKNAVQRYSGMRLTLNNPWETTLCFIISQFNNVKKIRLTTKNIINKFGPKVYADGIVVGKGFPSSEMLSKQTVKDFQGCGAGFRAKYIKEAAEYCTNNLDLGSLNGKTYEEIKENLMVIPGVGSKVADCIALMGYGKLEAFPIDVWVKRTMEKVYFNGRKKKEDAIRDLAFEKWGRMAGYAQQYLFWNGRQNDRVK